MGIELTIEKQKGQLDFMNWVRDSLGTDLRTCTLCGICTACCPARVSMEFAPMKIIELIRLGEQERVLSSKDLWECTDCKLCTQRCPVNIPVAEVLDVLRFRALKEARTERSKSKVDFYTRFLEQVKTYGRLDPGEDLGWETSSRPAGGGVLGVFAKKQKREPLATIRDVPSFFEFYRKLHGIAEEPAKEVKPAPPKEGKKKR